MKIVTSRQRERAFTDLSSMDFGFLHVVERGPDCVYGYGKNERRYIMWKCRCVCGDEVIVRGTNLTSHHTESCKRCKRSLSLQGLNLEDLTGRIFNSWKVLYQADNLKHPSGKSATMWHCQCECGVEKDVHAGSLKSGESKSCGCSRMSKLEQNVKRCLDEYGFWYDREKSYVDLIGLNGRKLYYDFLVYAKDGKPLCFIECNGRQHYVVSNGVFGSRYGSCEETFKQQNIRDELKLNYAKNVLHIPVFYISYECDSEILVKKAVSDILQSVLK